MNEQEFNILSRINAHEFLLFQLYSLRLKDTDDPKESALLTQAHATEGMRKSLERDHGGEAQNEIVERSARHINAFFERLVQRFEE